MVEAERNYESTICDECRGQGYLSFRNGGDEECIECDGRGLIYEWHRNDTEIDEREAGV